MKKLWFKRKTYGWGWHPVTWQGWTITLVYLAILLILSFTLDENSLLKESLLIFFLPMAILTSIFIRIAYKTGEKPRWQWGEDKKDDTE